MSKSTKSYKNPIDKHIHQILLKKKTNYKDKNQPSVSNNRTKRNETKPYIRVTNNLSNS